MSKSSQRPSREEIKERRKKVKRAQQKLREKQKAKGLVGPPRVSIPNCTSPLKTEEEEQAAREQAATEQARIIRAQLPILLKRFSQIEDPRPRTAYLMS